MKVVFFEYGVLEQGGGTERYYIDTVVGLRARHPEIQPSIVTLSNSHTFISRLLLSIYFMKGTSKKALFREPTEQILTELQGVPYHKASSLRELRRLLRSADVIYSKNEIYELATLWVLGLKSLPPLIFGAHTPVHYDNSSTLHAKLHNLLYNNPIYRRTLGIGKVLKVLNSHDEAYMKSRLLNTQVIKILHPYEFKPAQKVYDGSAQLNVLYAGRLSEGKGVEVAITIAQHLLAQDNKSYRFRFAGAGDAKLEKQLGQLSAQHPEVEFLGHIENQKLGQQYEWADVVLVPSKYETLCQVAIEAGAYGKIVVATDTMGPREVIVDHVTGYLVPLGASSFESRLRKLASQKRNSPAELKAIGVRASTHIDANFNLDKHFTELYAAIKLTAQNHKQSHP